ncbi:MAG: phosphotransferase family protein [Dehalococcoidia bacterium]
MPNRTPPPNRGRLQQMIDTALPGGRVVSARRLRGGLDARVHAVRVALRDGTRTSVVLRRKAPDSRHSTAAQTETEHRTLTLLREAGVPSPRPLLLDAEGCYFDSPAMLMSYDGRPIVAPRNVSLWLSGLADALLTLRAVTPDRFDLTFLDSAGATAVRERIERPLPAAIAADPLAQAVPVALKRRFPAIDWSGACLVHRDFWPGNTVWRRGRFGAIIDWSTAAVGDPRIDLAQCRVDLAMMHGPEMAEAFLDAHRARTSTLVHDLWFFDLLIGLDDALATYPSWLPGYHDLGLTQVREEIAGERLRTFLALALRRSQGDDTLPD